MTTQDTSPRSDTRTVPLRLLRELLGAVCLVAGMVLLASIAFVTATPLGWATIAVYLIAAGVLLGTATVTRRGDR